MLIDTGANKSFIDPKYVHPSRIQKIPSVTINTLFQTHQITDQVTVNGLMEFKTREPLEFLVFKFHNYFDGLLGLELMQKLNIKLDFEKSTLSTKGTIIPLLFKPNLISKNYTVPPRSKIIMRIPVDKQEGDVYIKPIHIHELLVIPEGIYKAINWYALVECVNWSNKEQKCFVEQPIKAERLQDKYNIEINHSSITSNDTSKSKDISELIRTSHLNSEETKALYKLCKQYENIFFKETHQLTFTNQIKHDINLHNEKPAFTKSYRYPYIHKEEVRKQIDKMLDQGIIRSSYSPWSSPIWIVPKKADASGKTKWRLVVDYRKLNEQTVDDRYPLPNITEILDKLGKCMYFTTLDLASGFHQIEVNPRDIQKTAFTVDSGHYEYIRMPFGLKNAPSTFQRVMDNVLKDLQGKSCLCYMDDIIVFSTSLQEHISNLNQVFNKLEQANLKVQLDKSEFLHKEVAFLGHIVSSEGVKPNPEKIEAVKKFPIPKTPKQIKSFLGLLGYYRKFIKDFANLTKPMTECLRKDKKITMNPEYVNCFEKCKTLLCENPILQYPDFSKPFVLTTDASNVALGAVLSQGAIGLDRPICYASRTLTKTEQNYSTIEKELLAIVWSVRYFRPYLYGKKFQIVTDHKPLTWLFSLKEPNSKLVRWRLKLEEYEYEIVYKKGTKNTNADALSRLEPEIIELNVHSGSESTHSEEIGVILGNCKKDAIPTTNTVLNEFNTQIILELDSRYLHLETFFKIYYRKKRRYLIKSNEFDEQKLMQVYNEYIIPGKLIGIACSESTFKLMNEIHEKHFSNSKIKLVRSKLIVEDIVDELQQRDVITKIHQEGNHRGISENLEQLKRQFYFPKMKNLINQIINKCEICQTLKYGRNVQPIKLEVTENPKKPLEIIHIDIFAINNKKFLTILDKFSKFAVAYHLVTSDGLEVVKLMKNFISVHGIPQKLVTDRGVEFTSIIFKQFCEMYKITLHLTTPKASTGNSPVERLHSTLIEIYRIIYAKNHDKDPVEIMNETLITYNNSIHSVIKMTPFELKNGHISKPEIFPDKLPDKNPNDYLKDHKKNCEQLYNLIHMRNSKEKEALITQRNKNRIEPKTFLENETIYEKDNRRNKLSPRFQKHHVKKNNRVTLTTNKRKVHKAKVKHLLQVH